MIKLNLTFFLIQFFINRKGLNPMSKNGKSQQKQVSSSLFAHFTDISLTTDNHRDYYKSLVEQQDVVCTGVAGTAKTYIALYHALSQLNNRYIQKIIIVRSAVATRDIGFLKGSEEEKLEVYEAPYIKIVNDLLGRGDGYEVLKKRNEIEFLSSSYLRGLTFDNTFIIVDECQNMTFHEIDTIYTRVGNNTQLAFIGDYKQTDNGVGKKGTGINKLITLAENLSSFDLHYFSYDDIVRSSKVKSWIIQKDMLNL